MTDACQESPRSTGHGATSKTPGLVASTTDTYCCTIAESRVRERRLQGDPKPEAESQLPKEDQDVPRESNYFKSAQWSPDGTSLITSSADNTVRTFILPPSLLDPSDSSIVLTPYTAHTYPATINCLTTYPLFNLSDPSTTLTLSTPTALPIRLTNNLSQSPVPVSAYPFVSPTTEAYYTPSSLLWSTPNSFLAGTDCLIGVFDVSRNGEGPVTRLATIPSKRHKMKGGGVGMRGIVSALSIQPSSAEDPLQTGMVAAGTWTRWVGLYDAGGLGGTVATWSIAEAADIHACIGGTGVTQTLWSNCGRYLYVVERKSRGVLVFDVRVTGRLVSWLEGREAETNQRLSVDSFEGENGMELWAGGTDGSVRVWEGVGLTEGGCERSWEWTTHDDPVSSTIIHSSGSVVATCSGQRADLDWNDTVSEDSEYSDSVSDENDSSRDDYSSEHQSPRPSSQTPDCSIKVWSL